MYTSNMPRSSDGDCQFRAGGRNRPWWCLCSFGTQRRRRQQENARSSIRRRREARKALRSSGRCQKTPSGVIQAFHFCGTTSVSCCFYFYIGGEGGIRTPGRLAPSTDFESAPFGHSGTSPWRRIIQSGGLPPSSPDADSPAGEGRSLRLVPLPVLGAEPGLRQLRAGRWASASGTEHCELGSASETEKRAPWSH